MVFGANICPKYHTVAPKIFGAEVVVHKSMGVIGGT